ncbi:uncharacterized protein LOC143026730 [Oratosquilla oratoria]|uniref:uncharacterized protein LOC143026730 n=1 Tax=Oratosquilla oratoria TaxID=337810 RepID=UPI003F764493
MSFILALSFFYRFENGFLRKRSYLLAIAQQYDFDIILLQETLQREEMRFPGYHIFSLPRSDTTRAAWPLSRTAYPAAKTPTPYTVAMAWRPMRFSYNEAMRPSPSTTCTGAVTRSWTLGKRAPLLGTDSSSSEGILTLTTHLCHPHRGPNAAGNHLHLTLTSSPHIALLNDGSPTHVWGDVAPPPVVPHIPRWNTSKANWPRFSNALASWATEYNPSAWDVDSVEADLSTALHAAASDTIPLQGQPTRRHKNHWYYNEEMRDAYHRVCMFLRAFRRNRTQVSLANLRAAVREAHATATRVRVNKFYEWCKSFNAHTSLSELSRKLHVATNRSRPRLTHHASTEEAQRLVEEFASRTSSAFLLQRTQETQQQLREGRIHHVGDMMAQTDETDEEFTLGELMATRRPDKDTASGEGGVTYSILAHLGPAGDEAFLRVINGSWRTGRLPTAWKTATIVLIPKPKEPGAYRPISLVSCMGKTAERMVLNRLLWKLGPLHEHIYAYRKGTGTAHSIATLLATVSSEPSIAIFLDLEKAFELASPLAIQDTIVCKGVRGRLLTWIGDYLSRRSAFHGAREWYTTESPTLFNVLISNVLELPLPHGCKIISYTDDLALIIAGKQRCHDWAQRCFDAVAAECVRIGLKISPRKSKDMAFGLGRGKELLVTQGFALDWVTQFQYLGVWLDKGLTFNREISYLRERMTARTTVMRAMCGRALGATHQVLCTYYVQAVPSIADYAVPALLTADADKLQRLETYQNEAARIILGAQRWYKILNFQRKASLPPLQLMIRMLGADFVARGLYPRDETGLSRAIHTSLARADILQHPNTWLSHAAKLLDSFQLRQPLLEKGITKSHPDFKCPPPWAPAPNKTAHTTGAAFVTDRYIFGRRASDSASSLQAEAMAMQGALEHALVSHSNSVVIHTDSLNLISCLQQPKDNVYLITNIIALLHKLHLAGRNVIINWVPSHIGVHGNDLADAAADAARKRASVDLQVPPSKSQLQLRTRSKRERVIQQCDESYVWHPMLRMRILVVLKWAVYVFPQ